MELRQSTAAVVPIGPLVDVNGAAITTATLTQAKVILAKHDSTTFAQKNDATSCTHRSSGVYTCPLNTTDTDTAGRFTLVVAESGALILTYRWEVLTASAWDAKYASGNLAVDVVKINGSAPAAVNAALAFNSFVIGAVVADAGNSPTQIKTNLASSVNDYIKNRPIMMTSGACIYQFYKIGGYAGATKIVTAAGTETFTTTPTATDTFMVL